MKNINGNDCDREFFKANPERNYSLRMATQDELDWYMQYEPPPPDNFFIYAVSRRLESRKRISCLAVLRGHVDPSEENAKLVWDVISEPGFFEKKTRCAMLKPNTYCADLTYLPEAIHP